MSMEAPSQLLAQSQEVLDIQVASALKRAQDFEEDSDYDECLNLAQNSTRLSLQALLAFSGRQFGNNLRTVQNEVAEALPEIWAFVRFDVINVIDTDLEGDFLDRERGLLGCVVSACRVLAVIANQCNQYGFMSQKTHDYESRLEYLERE